MSFILDALKKIEEDKRRADDSPMESIAVSHSRFGSRQSTLTMVAIAVGSALLTAAAVSFLTRPPQPTPSETSTRSPSPQTSELPPSPPASVVAPPVVREASVLPIPSAAAPASDSAPDAAPVPEPDAEAVVDAEADTYPADTTPPSDDLQPVRIVGRERALLDGLKIDTSSDTPSPNPSPNEDEPLPDHFPNLVLQGTSMIGDNAVAVISDQRVFEGDRIEGALVVRIGEREVELELDGRRFTLSL